MNKIYKSIWSVSKGTYVAVSELARGKGKSSSCRLGGSQKTGCAASSYLQNNHAGKHIGAWAANCLPSSFRLSQLAVLISLGGLAGSAMAAAPQAGTGNGLAMSTENCHNAKANAEHLYSIAIGCGANAKSIFATSLLDRFNPIEVTEGLVYEPDSGNGPTTLRKEAGIAIGSRSNVDTGAVALGGGTSSEAVGVAVGTWARAAHSAISVGARSHAAGESAIAVGRQAVSKGQFSMAFGNVAAAEGDSALAMGHSATAKGAGSIAIGGAVRYWKDLERYTDKGEIIPEDPTGYSPFSARANGISSIALGNGTRANSYRNIALGYVVSTEGNNAIGIGPYAEVSGNESIAFGMRANAKSDGSIAMGRNARVRSAGGVGIGDQAHVESNGVAIGRLSNADGSDSTALGPRASAAFSRAVALGAYSNADNAPTPVANYTYTPVTGTPLTKNFAGTDNVAVFSVGNSHSQQQILNVKRQIQNVAAGRISDTSTDAINGSQLFVTNEMAQQSLNAVRTLNNIVGGNTTVNPESNEITLGNDIYVGSAKDNRQPADTKKVIESIEALGENKAQGADLANYLGGGSAPVTENGRATGAVTAPVYHLVDGKPSEEKSKNYNNVGDALSALNTAVTQPITIATDDGSTTDRKLGSTLKVLGADTISTSMEGPDTLKIAAKTTPLSVNDGRVGIDGGDAAKGNLVTAESVANAINESHFNVNAGATADGAVSGNAQSPVKAGDTVNYIAGKNIKLTQADKGFTFETKDDVSFNKVAIGTGGLTVQNGAPIDMGGNKITNVADGTAAGDAVNLSQLDGVKAIADNAAAEAAKGWNLQANGDAASKVAPGDKVQFLDGTNINVTRNGNDLTIATAPALTADSLTINGGPVIKGTGIDMGGKKITGVANGTEDTDAVNLSQLNAVAGAAATEVAAGTNIASVQKTEGANGQSVYTVNAKGAAVSAGSDKIAVTSTTDAATNLTTYGVDLSDAAKASLTKADSALQEIVTQIDGADVKTLSSADNKVNFVSGDNIALTDETGAIKISVKPDLLADSLTINNGGPVINKDGIDMGGKKVTNVADGSAPGDAVNFSQLDGVKAMAANAGAEAAKGWNLQANGDAASKVAPGDKVQFLDGTNINVTRNGNDLTIATAPALTADSLTINGGPVIKGTGIDMGGKKITGVANGTEDTDAVNLSQLNAVAGAAATEVAAGTNIASVQKTEGANGQSIYTVNAKGAAVSGGSDKIAVTSTTDAATNLTTYGVDLSDAAKASLTKADSALQEIVTQIDGADVKTLSSADNKVNFTSGDNIALVNDSGAIKINVKPDLTADSLTINNGGPVISSAGIDMQDKKLTNVAPGTLSADSKDGVNAGQLFALGNSTAAAFGGNSTFNPDTGAVVPSLTVGDKTFTNVNDALGDLNTTLASTNAEVNKGWNLQANGDAATKVAPGDKVQFLDGTNINVTRNGNDLTIATTPALTADSLTINNGGPVLNVDGINMNDKKLTNVAAGTLSADSKDGVNAGQLFTVGDSTAQALGGDSAFDPVTGKVTAGLKVGDKTFNNVNSALTAINDNVTSVATRGWDIAGADGVVGSVATGAQVQFLAGDNHTKVNVAQENGISKVTVSTAASPLQYSDTANANGQNAAAAPFEVTNSVTLVGKDAAAPVSLNNVAKATLSEDSLQAVNGQQLYGLGDSIAKTLGGGTYFNADTGKLSTKIRVDGSEYNSVADALDNIGRAASGGWNLQLNNDTPQKVDSGATVGFNQGSNIQLTRDGNQITVATAPNVTFDSVKTDRLEGDVVSAKSYLGVIDGPALTQQGIDAAGKPITNVGPGDISEGSTDAVTGGQLYSLAGGTAAAINRLQSNLDRVAKDADAGSATAGAMANLPQAYLPGKSMFALATARYVGQQGFAAGLSKVSENGNWIIKGSVSGNTRGKTMVGAGIGYQW